MTKKIDHLIFEEFRFQADHLGLFRMCYALLSIFVIGIPDFRILHTLPDYIYDPPLLSIASFSSGFPEYTFLMALSIALFILHFTVLFGYKTKISSIFLTLLLVIGYSFYFSIGKINHGSMITIWIPLLMGLAGWGQAYSIDSYQTAQDSKSKVRGWPVFLLLSLLAFGMFAAGLPKLLGGWLDTSTHAVRGHFLKNYYVLGRQDFWAPFFKDFNIAVIWESFDYFAVIFELGFLLALFRKRFLNTYIILAMIFHIANALILNIAFIDNFPVYLLLFPFSLIFEQVDIDRYAKKIFTRSVFLFVMLFFAFFIFFIDQSITIFAMSTTIGVTKQTVELLLMVGLLLIYSTGMVLHYAASRDKDSYSMYSVHLNLKS